MHHLRAEATPQSRTQVLQAMPDVENATDYPLGGGPNSKRGRWCCACVEERGQETLEAEARATPEMVAAMQEILSLVTGQEPCNRTANVVTGIGESLNV